MKYHMYINGAHIKLLDSRGINKCRAEAQAIVDTMPVIMEFELRRAYGVTNTATQAQHYRSNSHQTARSIATHD